MREPLTLVLEFLRTENVNEPYAFRFARQTYSLRTSAGTYEKAELGWDQALLANLDAVQKPTRDPEAVQRLGETLRSFLAGTEWSRHEEQIVAASAEHRPIVLTFRSAAAELYALPWELLTLKSSGLPLGALPELVLRYEWPEETARPPSAAEQSPPAAGGRILLAWSGQVPADEHLAAIESATTAGYYPFNRDTDVLPHASLAKLKQTLTTAAQEGAPFAVLHLLCHGGADAAGKTFGLLLSDADSDQSVLVDAASLRAQLAPLCDTLRLVVLSACDSGNLGALGNQLGSVAQTLHRAGIAGVVASRFPLSVKGSGELARHLYQGLLVELLSLEQALCRTRQQLLLQTTGLDWASLQYYARAADGDDSRPLIIRPYRGLLPFLPEHQRFFFGRDEEIAHLLGLHAALAAAGKPRLLLLLGTAGTGKSSLMLAGVVPRLLASRPEFVVARMRPGSDPEAMLESELADVRASRSAEGKTGDLGAVLLVVDQLEELFTQTADPGRRQAFIRRLWALATDPAGQVHVLIGLRVEQLARCGDLSLDGAGAHQRLDALAGNPAHRFFLARVDPRYFKDVIDKPAQAVGLRLEDGLTERLLADASELAGAQPLLADILDVLWQHRRGSCLTQAAYDALGGLSGALEGRAEKLIASFDADEQRVVRRLFVRLVTSTPDMTLLTRRCVAVDALRPEDPAENDRFTRVLTRLVEARLLVSSEEDLPPEAPGANEAASARSDGQAVGHGQGPTSMPILRALLAGPLRGGVSSKPPFGDVLNLSGLLHSSHSGGHPVVRSAPGVRGTASLVEVAHEALIHKWGRLRGWLKEDRHMLVELEKLEGWIKQWREMQTLLYGYQLSYAHTVAQRYPDELPRGARELLAQSTRRSIRRLRFRRAIFVMFVLATLALIYTTHSTWQSSRRARLAASNARDALRILSASESGADPLLRVHLLRAVEADDPLRLHGWVRLATETLHELLPAEREFSLGRGEEILDVAADCERVVTSRNDELVRVYSIGGSQPPRTLGGHRDRINRAALSRDGGLLLTAANDRTARLFRLNGNDNGDSDAEPLVLHGSPTAGALLDAQLGAADRQVATLAEDGSVRLYATDGNGEPAALLAGAGAARTLAYSPDGTRLLTGSNDGTVRLFDDKARELGQFVTGARVLSAGFSADGSEVVVASADQRVRIFKTAAAGAPPVELLSPTQGLPRTPALDLRGATLSADGLHVLTYHGGQARLLGRHDENSIAVLSGPGEPLLSAGFCADGQRLYTVWGGGRLVLWPQGHPRSDLPLAVLPTHGVVAAQFSPNGRRLAVAGADRLAQVMNTDGAGSSLVLAGHRGDLTAIAWSADNFTLATASEDETIGLWQDGAARPPRFLRGHRGAVTHLSWSPTGELLASAGADKQVLVWSTDGTHDAPVLAIATAGPVLGLELGRTSNRVLVRSAGATANVAPTLSLLRSEQPAPPDVLYAGPLLDARFSPDGKKVVAVLPDGTLRVWTVDGQAGVDTFRAPGGAPLHDARFSPDGKQLLAAAGPHIVVFDAEQPEQSALVVSPLPERTKPAAPRLELQTLLPLADGKQALAVYPDRVVLTPLQGGAPTVIDTAVVGGSATTVLSPTGGAFVRVDAGGTAWRFSTEPPAEPLATALMHRLWQASRQCIAPENQTRPRGERARPGALTVASALCETLQRCLSTSQDSDPFPACYARLRPRHLGSYE